MQYVNVVLFAGLALVCLRMAQRHRTAAARWAAVTFGVIGAIMVVALVLPEDTEDLSLVAVKILVFAILVYPYALYRFAATFERLPLGTDRVVSATTAAVAIATIALPRFPGEGDPRPGWFVAYLLTIIFWWAGLGALVSRRLWSAGRALGAVARYRMRTLALGAAGMAVALLPSVVPPEQQPIGLRVFADALPAVSAVLFFAGFAPPAWLRSMWRRSEESALRRVELDLIRAESRDAVLAAVLPHAAALVGGNTATFVRGDAAGATADHQEESGGVPVRVAGGAVRLPAAGGLIVVEAGPYTPFFGQDELDMLRSLAAYVDLVLARMELLERERDTRAAAERTSSELETLVYGISHDLKSPVISLLGYLEYLREDHGQALGEEGRHYVDRMEKAALYMQALLGDLLELSRVGRVGVDATDVDLGPLVDDVRVDVVSTFPQLSVDIGDLPVVSMNASRARQLFINLIENAARHGGRNDITVRVFGAVRDDGSAVVSVVDDGVGIPREYHDKAFGIFERLAPRDSVSGTGIGLALCRKIVETIGGTVDIVDSPAGTHVRIIFPTAAVRTERRQTIEVSR